MEEQIRLIWLPEAIIDFERIYDSHAANSQQGADRLKRRIFEAADTLAIFPTAGQVEPYLQRPGEIYRSFVADKRYKLIYTIENNGTLVSIQGIWPCKRDPRCMSSFIFNRLRSL